MDDLIQDLKYGARMLRKRPGFTVVAVLTLALGIGANSAIFSSVNAILLQPLPLRDRDRLVLFDATTSEGTSVGSPSDEVWHRWSNASYLHLKENVPALEDVAAFRSGETRLNLLGEEGGAAGAQLATGHLVSGNYFSLLGVPAVLGRPLAPDDDREAAPPVAVISHACWKTRYAGDPAVVGRAVTVNGTPLTIAGVMPEWFFGLRIRRAADFWLPLALQPRIERTTESYLAERDVYWLNLVGRLKPGSDIAAANAQVNVALKQYLRSAAGTTPEEDWQRAIDHGTIRLAPAGPGISGLRVHYGEPLKVLMAVAGFVLLIACANLTNLLLSRATERRAEIAMRLAMGAARGRLIRQALTESLMLAALGGAAGLLLALWGVEALRTLVSKSAPIDVGLNLPVLAFTAGVSILAGLLFGLAPALRTGRADLSDALRSRGETGGGRLRSGLGPALVATQVALSLVLLVGSGLLVRSLVNLAGAEVGFQRDGVAVLDIDTRVAGLQTSELSDYYRRLLERVGGVPGVKSATVATYSPMNGTSRSSSLTVEGYTSTPGDAPEANVILVGPRYAETLGIPIVKGRIIDDRDGPAATKVAFVNEAFARAYFAGADPIGRRVSIGDEPENPRYEVIGIVGDASYDSPREAPARMLYLGILQAQDQSAYASDLEVRTAGDPMTAVTDLRHAVGEVDGRVPIASVTSLRAQVADSVSAETLLAQLVSVFSVLALVLACVGLYGVVSQAVARRTNEVGIRMALGADRRRILTMVLGEAGRLILAGLAVGIPGAAITARLLTSQLYGVAPADPLTIVASAGLLLAVALFAGYIPARRASRVEPLVALRAE